VESTVLVVALATLVWLTVVSAGVFYAIWRLVKLDEIARRGQPVSWEVFDSAYRDGFEETYKTRSDVL
jgi:hypothetical protein